MRLQRLGVNVGFDPIFRPSDIAAAGFNLVRIVLQPHIPLHDYIDECHRNGVQVLGVVTNRSCERQDEGRTMDHPETAEWYASQYADRLDYWQMGNEPDRDPHGGHRSSWCMSSQECSALIQCFVQGIRNRAPDAYIIGPGLASGQPDYVQQLDLSGLTAIAVHPYEQTPESVQTLFEWNYGPNFLGQRYPIFITEFGVPDPDADARAAYLWEMVKRFEQLPYVEAAVWYCWAKLQNTQDFYVVDSDGETVVPTAVYYTAQQLGYGPP